jgi:hypothetical protein
VEILIARPCCTYYFGPFESVEEAVLAQPGYIEDLVNEGAQGIAVQIKWCKPRNLTIFFEDELAESSECWTSQPRNQHASLGSQP